MKLSRERQYLKALINLACAVNEAYVSDIKNPRLFWAIIAQLSVGNRVKDNWGRNKSYG